MNASILRCQNCDGLDTAAFKLWLRRTAILMVASVSLVLAAAEPAWGSLTKKPDEWFRSQEGRHLADTVLSWQSVAGSWPKNMDTTAQPFTGDPKTLSGTFDNGATTVSEIESERRNGYGWYGDWGARVAQDYALWKQKGLK